MEEKQHLQVKKEEAWQFFRRLPNFKPKKNEDFGEEHKREVMTGVPIVSHDGRERYLEQRTHALRKKALEEDRRPEARERSKIRQVPSPFLRAAPCGVEPDALCSGKVVNRRATLAQSSPVEIHRNLQ